MQPVAYILLLLSAGWLIGVALFAACWPKRALESLAGMASTNWINYSEITLRLTSGLAFLFYADSSRFPQVLRIFGWILIATSAMLYLVPRRWHHRYALFWSRMLNPYLLRVAAVVSLAAGMFLLFAIH